MSGAAESWVRGMVHDVDVMTDPRAHWRERQLASEQFFLNFVLDGAASTGAEGAEAVSAAAKFIDDVVDQTAPLLRSISRIRAALDTSAIGRQILAAIDDGFVTIRLVDDAPEVAGLAGEVPPTSTVVIWRDLLAKTAST